MTSRELPLPESLTFHRTAIEAALGLPIPGEWPEGEGMLRAEQPAALGEALVGALHPHLVDARIAYLFVKDKQEHGRLKLGHASKAPAKVRFLADVDYVIELNWGAWRDLTPEQRIAIVDHELCHCAGKDDKGKWVERGHDVEEFSVIVGRWGLWKKDLQAFGAVVSRQIRMFD